MNAGASILHVTPETTTIPSMIAINTSVVPKSFCKSINNIGTKEVKPILVIN